MSYSIKKEDFKADFDYTFDYIIRCGITERHNLENGYYINDSSTGIIFNAFVSEENIRIIGARFVFTAVRVWVDGLFYEGQEHFLFTSSEVDVFIDFYNSIKNESFFHTIRT